MLSWTAPSKLQALVQVLPNVCDWALFHKDFQNKWNKIKAGKQHGNRGAILGIYLLLTDYFKRGKLRFLSNWAWLNG